MTGFCFSAVGQSILGQALGAVSAFYKRLAYRNKWAEASLYTLFLTGLPLWSVLNPGWTIERFSLFAHTLASLSLYPVFVIPFWMSHRRLLQSSQKPGLKKTGHMIDVLLLLCSLSGLYLLFLGNRGEVAGVFNHYLHLFSTLPIAGLVLYHALRWTVLRPLFRLFPYRPKN